MKGVSKCKHFLTWLFTSKRLLLSDKYRLKCPRCGSKMDKIDKNNIVIDVCPNCNGMWLDDGEIEKLVSIAKNKTTKKNTKKVKTNGKKN